MKSVFLTAIVGVLTVSVVWAAGETNITTYYPSPTGFYQTLKIKDALILLENNTFNCGGEASKISVGIKNGKLVSCKGASTLSEYNVVPFYSADIGTTGIQYFPSDSGKTAHYLNLAGGQRLTGIGYENGLLTLNALDNPALSINATGGVEIMQTLGIGIATANLNGNVFAVEGDAAVVGDLSVGLIANPAAGITSAGHLTAKSSVIENKSTVGSLEVFSAPSVKASIDSSGNSIVANSTVNGNAKITGNVGIGIAGAVASQKLEVSGNASISGNTTSEGTVSGGGIQLPVSANPTCKDVPGCMWIDPT